MSAEGSIDVHGPNGAIGRAAHRDGAEARLFLSTRLVRELVAADALADAEGDDRPALAWRLLEVIRAGLALPMAGIVDSEPLACLAAHAIPDGVRAVLEGRVSGGSASSVPLVRRALDEHRAFLLGRGSRDPLMVVLRDARPEIEAVAVVPLHDRDLPIGLLVLGATDDAFVNAATLRTLTVAFRLLALLLSPGRGGRDQTAGGTAAEAERYLVEIEELERRLADANDVVRRAREQSSSEVAALRAEVEAARARIAELEAAVAGERNESDLRRDVESECSRLQRELEEKGRVASALEAERDGLLMRVTCAEEEAESARQRVVALEEQLAANLPIESGATGTVELEASAEPLGEFVALAAAAVEADGEGEVAIALEVGDETEGEPGSGAAISLDEPAGLARILWHVESGKEIRQAAQEIADAHGVPLWRGEGERPAARAEVLVANLLDPTLAADPAVLLPADARTLWLYGWDQETSLGFEIGAACCLARPVDPAAILAQMQTFIGKKITGVVLVSAQLRELAGVRAALSEIDAAGSVACDARQALDLLEIVRQPDALLIDLSLDGGQGLALAHQLRRTPATSDLPILFLLPPACDLSALRAGADRSGILGPYGHAEVRRLVTGALASRR
jgi:CheY-like chemotaxis protein